MFQGNSKQGLIERALDIVKECLLASWRDSVDAAESETQKTVIIRVLLELGAYLLSSLDSLLRGSDSTDSNGVSVYIATSTTAIAV